MSVRFFSEHAVERAQERYGLKLSAADMGEIIRATNDGRAQLMSRHETGGNVFIWRFKGQPIYPLVNVEGEFIISFMPKDYFRAGGRLEKYSTKTTAPSPKQNSGRQEYHRARSTREAMRNADDGWTARRGVARI